MVELSEVHEKINKVSLDVAFIKGQLLEKWKNLVTLSDLLAAFDKHEKTCPVRNKPITTSITPRRPSGKQAAGIGVVLTALTAAIYALIEYLKH